MDDIDIFTTELTIELERLSNILIQIKKIIDNEKITGIEAKLMIKDIFEENEL